MTTRESYIDFLQKLKDVYEEQEAANIADWVFENVLHLKRWERRENPKTVTAQQSSQLEKYLDDLLKHKPVQYVLNEAWFYKMKFFVDESVLIPRPETEELVSWVIDEVRSSQYYTKFKILDIGTGSGCIAISLKKELRNIYVTAIDTSQKALAVAKKNADTMQAEIDFCAVDFLNENLWDSFNKYDVIVSNPPYIPEKEKDNIAKNVLAFEPAIALFVPNDDSFIFYQNIAKFGKSHLKKNGKIFVEIHENYSAEVRKIFNEYNYKTEIRKDIYGKERMIKAEI